MQTTDNALVSVDLSEINDKAMLARADRSPPDHGCAQSTRGGSEAETIPHICVCYHLLSNGCTFEGTLGLGQTSPATINRGIALPLNPLTVC
jgi:hypothetical protein